jgi:hypothetical protein
MVSPQKPDGNEPGWCAPTIATHKRTNRETRHLSAATASISASQAGWMSTGSPTVC